MLLLPLKILGEPDKNPFVCTSSDVKKAYPMFNLFSPYVLQ